MIRDAAKEETIISEDERLGASAFFPPRGVSRVRATYAQYTNVDRPLANMLADLINPRSRGLGARGLLRIA